MGANGSTMSSNGGQLVVSLDQPHIVAGEQITGKVYLNLGASKNCSSLEMKICGAEVTRVHYTTTSGTGKNKKTHHHTAHGRDEFLTVNFALASFPANKVEAGNYEYPFQATLPQNSLSSLSGGGNGGRSSSWRVEYNVDVRLHAQSFVSWDVRHTLPFMVYPAPILASAPSPAYIDARFHSVAAFCCMKQGRMVVGAALSDTTLGVGESAVLNYAVKNESTARIKAIEVMVIEQTRWRARGHSAARRNTLFQKRMDIDADQASSDDNDASTPIGLALEAKKKVQHEKGPVVFIDSADIEYYYFHERTYVFVDFEDEYTLRAMMTLIDEGKHKVQVSIAGDSYPSFTGRLISTTHTLYLKIHTVFGSENIIIQEPIYVHSNPVVGSLAVPIAVAEGGDNPIVPVTVPSQVPAGWNPVVADVVVLPAVSYVTANTVEQDEGDESDAPVAYVAPPAYNYEGFNVLLQILDGAYDQQTELSRWLCFAGNKADNLSREEYRQLFQAFNRNSFFEQPKAAAYLVGSDSVAGGAGKYATPGVLTRIRCDQLAGALEGCDEDARRRVAETLLAVPVVDKENKEVVKPYLSLFQFMTIESHFN